VTKSRAPHAGALYAYAYTLTLDRHQPMTFGEGPRALLGRGLIGWKRSVSRSLSRSCVRICIKLLTCSIFKAGNHGRITAVARTMPGPFSGANAAATSCNARATASAA
jgi:hypothetical protein